MKGYTSEEAYRILSMTNEREEASLSESQSDSNSLYEPVEISGTLTDSSNDGVAVLAKVRRTQPCSSVAEDGSRMQQRASTSAAQPPGKLASTSGQYTLVVDKPALQYHLVMWRVL